MPSLVKKLHAERKGITAAYETSKRDDLLKSVSFCLETSNQLAARFGGAASLIEAQAVASHGLEAVKSASSDVKVAIVKRACVQNQASAKTVGEDLSAVDPVVEKMQRTQLAKALRDVQMATISVAAVTEVHSPSALSVKDKFLKKLFLAVKKQGYNVIINKPYLALLNEKIKKMAV